MIYQQWSQQRFEALQRFLLPGVLVVMAVLLLLAYGRPFESPLLTVPDFSRHTLQFVPNEGQSEAVVHYTAHMPGSSLFFTEEGLTFSGAGGFISWEFVGADSAEIQATRPLPGVVNYLYGADAGQWRTGLPTYGQVSYAGLYPGVAVDFGGSPGQLAATIQLAAGVEPGLVQWRFAGGTPVLNENGGLVLVDGDGQTLIEFERPVALQQAQEEAAQVAANFVINEAGIVALAAAGYNRSETLTFLMPVNSPESHGSDWGEDVVANDALDMIVTGGTGSLYFPTEAPLQAENAGELDAFITKFSANGDMLFSTYLGGSDSDRGEGVDLDQAGNIILTGYTTSSDFPLINELMPDQPGEDTFISKISADGSQLLFSSYLGGGGNDRDSDVAVDAQGDIYISGRTSSADFPLLNPIQGTFGGGDYDAFLTKIAGNSYQLIFSTYFGGIEWDDSGGIDIDQNGDVFITGWTSSPNFPVVNTGIPQPQTSPSDLSVFISKIATDGSSLLFSAMFGGSGIDYGNAVSVDPSGNPYVVGETSSVDFPVVNPIQGVNNGESDAFVTRIAGDGSSLLFSTYFGGSLSEYGFGIVVGGVGNVYLTGVTYSFDFPQVNPLPGMGYPGQGDAFVAMQSGAGNLVWSTYLGGSYWDFGNGIEVDNIGRPVVVGQTYSTDFPTVNPYQSFLNYSSDAFVSRLNHAGNNLEYSTYLGGGAYPVIPPTDVAVSGFEGTAERNVMPYLLAALALIMGGFMWWRQNGRRTHSAGVD